MNRSAIFGLMVMVFSVGVLCGWMLPRRARYEFVSSRLMLFEPDTGKVWRRDGTRWAPCAAFDGVSAVPRDPIQRVLDEPIEPLVVAGVPGATPKETPREK